MALIRLLSTPKQSRSMQVKTTCPWRKDHTECLQFLRADREGEGNSHDPRYITIYEELRYIPCHRKRYPLHRYSCVADTFAIVRGLCSSPTFVSPYLVMQLRCPVLRNCKHVKALMNAGNRWNATHLATPTPPPHNKSGKWLYATNPTLSQLP